MTDTGVRYFYDHMKDLTEYNMKELLLDIDQLSPLSRLLLKRVISKDPEIDEAISLLENEQKEDVVCEEEKEEEEKVEELTKRSCCDVL